MVFTDGARIEICPWRVHRAVHILRIRECFTECRHDAVSCVPLDSTERFERI